MLDLGSTLIYCFKVRWVDDLRGNIYKGIAMRHLRDTAASGLNELYVQRDLHVFANQNPAGLKSSVPG